MLLPMHSTWRTSGFPSRCFFGAGLASSRFTIFVGKRDYFSSKIQQAPHLSCTWPTYLHFSEDEELPFPHKRRTFQTRLLRPVLWSNISLNASGRVLSTTSYHQKILQKMEMVALGSLNWGKLVGASHFRTTTARGRCDSPCRGVLGVDILPWWNVTLSKYEKIKEGQDTLILWIFPPVSTFDFLWNDWTTTEPSDGLFLSWSCHHLQQTRSTAGQRPFAAFSTALSA